MTDRPLAKPDLVMESVDDGTIVYVRQTLQAHYLDEVATSVWNACDGTRTAADIGRYLGRDVASVDATLQRLATSELLAPSTPHPDERSEEINRRSLLRRGAVAGAAMTVGAGTILSVDVPTALATMSHQQTLSLFATSAAACNTSIGSNLRGSVVITVSGVPGNPALDKLTLVVTLIAYSTGLATEIFNISINCGTTLGTITTGSTGSGGPVTVTTTVPHNQVSVVTVAPTLGTAAFTKATASFIG